MFSRRELRNHLRAPKQIRSVEFKPPAKSRVTPPSLRLRGKRIHHTDILDAGGDYRVLFLWRDGAKREQRAYYCYLYLQQRDGYQPLARIDYHPSHKDIHMVVNCEDQRQLLNRNLPGCRELALSSRGRLDPAQEHDRNRLIRLSMDTLKITFEAPEGGLL